MLAILASITWPYIKLAERAYEHAHPRAPTRKHPSNNPQFGRGSRNARALISPGVFSSTGSRPWISTIRLVQRQPRREFRFLRKPPDSIRARAASKCYYNTLREYKRRGGGGVEGRGGIVMRLLMAISRSILSLCRQPSNPARPSSPAIHQRRERGV